MAEETPLEAVPAPPAGPDREATPAAAEWPTLTESLLALGLLAVAAVGCWLLYGEYIQLTLDAMWKFWKLN